MSSNTFSISRLISGGIITNYFCTSRCGHCLYRCSPRWPRDYIDSVRAGENFSTAARLGCRSMHIGGGEPLLDPESLHTVLHAARCAGVAIEYVETNCSWFTDQESACALLEGFLGKGLTTLLISISPFHNEYIPFFKTSGVLDACSRTGMGVFPWIGDFLDELSVFDARKTHSREEYEHHFGEEYWNALPGRYGIAKGGRALATYSKCGARRTIPSLVAESRCGCGELAEVNHFHLDLYGNYIPGLCSGLSIDAADLGLPLDPERYPALWRLYTKGVGGLLCYAMEEFGYEATRPAYASKCELCFEIRRFLVVECGLTGKDLQPSGHYRYD